MRWSEMDMEDISSIVVALDTVVLNYLMFRFLDSSVSIPYVLVCV